MKKCKCCSAPMEGFLAKVFGTTESKRGVCCKCDKPIPKVKVKIKSVKKKSVKRKTIKKKPKKKAKKKKKR